MATYSITPPETFDFRKADTFPTWFRRFERFRVASGLSSKSEEEQINCLIYHMGSTADDILLSFRLSKKDSKNWAVVTEKLQKYFVKKRNVIYERAKFNMRCQEPDEPVESFITDLYRMSEHCNFGTLKDELIRDRIVVGVRDARLSQRLQLNSELTLAKAEEEVCQNEAVKAQQHIVRNQSSTATKQIEAVHKTHKSHKSKPTGKSRKCFRCGASPSHSKQQCPAKDHKCKSCRKEGHYERECFSKKNKDKAIKSVEQEYEYESDDDGAFMGALDNGEKSKWKTKVKINGKSVDFKVDTGADVTIITEKEYEKFPHIILLEPTTPLVMIDSTRLSSPGYFMAEMKKGDKTLKENVYVVKGAKKNLLGHRASEGLGIVKFMGAVEKDFPALFKGLGKLQEPYDIRIEETATPYAVQCPRRVPIPLKDKVKRELDILENQGVIAKVKQPTSWCAPMVVVPKSNGKIRICVDLTKLNLAVKRERLMLPSVETMLGQMANAHVFSKIDCNSGFHQIPLSDASSLLTTFITPFGRYCYRRLPFGINSGPEHFQRRVCEILDGLPVACLMDDIVVYGSNQKEHRKAARSAEKTARRRPHAQPREKFLLTERSGVPRADRVS